MAEDQALPDAPHDSWFASGGLIIPRHALPNSAEEFLPLDASSGRGAPDWLRVVDALFNAEVAGIIDDGIQVPPQTLWDLEPLEQELLNLPSEIQDHRFRAVASGIPGKPGFKAHLEILPGDQPLPLPTDRRRGPFVQTPSGLRRLPTALLPVVAELDRPRASRDLEADMLHLGTFRSRALAAGIELSPLLKREEIQSAEGLGIEADFVSPEELHLHPVIEGIDHSPPGVGEGESRRVYTTVSEGGRKRVVLNDAQRKALNEVQQVKVLRGADVPRFQENPAAFLPEEFDLSRFSPRVKGIVPYRYRSQPYLAIDRKTDRDWFEISAGAELIEDEDVFTGESREELASGHTPPPSSSAPGAAGDGRSGRDGFSQEVFAHLCKEVIATGLEYVLHNGAWVVIAYEEAKSFLESIQRLATDESGTQGTDSAGRDLILDVATNLTVLEYIEEPSEVDDLSDDLPPPTAPEYPPPSLLQAELRPYQLHGYRWLRHLYEQRNGGLLADDMGLGKTVQVIALLAHLKEMGELKPSLIVVPKTLMTNWQREIERFCPEISLIYHHQGPDRSRNETFLSNCEVVLVTYQTLRIDQRILGTIDWRAVVCDEAQNVKNPSAQVTSAVKAMKAQVRVAMTGTPVENGLSELWCIADFVQAGRLGTQKEFRDAMERPITEAGTDTESAERAMRLLHERLGPHYMRRTKKVLKDELPEKQDYSYRVGLGARQEQLYRNLLQRIDTGDTIPIAGLQKLIQTCSHPELIQRSREEVGTLVAECPKLEQTVSILRAIEDAGEKVLLFTRYRMMQDILQRVIEKEFDSYASILNGAVSGGQRQPLVDRFQSRSGFGALILAPEAAGVGLNITGANHVIHYSRLWNPAKERQATDRVYRIKQTRPVLVHYPIVTGDGWDTVEEHLDDLLQEKSDLAEYVIMPSNRLNLQSELQQRMQSERSPS